MKRPTRLGLVVTGVLVVSGILAGCSGVDENAGPHGLPRRASSSNDAGPTAPTVIEAAAGPSCSNGVRDGDETDIDCGGGACPACANGRACVAARDCASLV